MQLLTVGPRGYTVSTAVATKTFTPLFDRAAHVTDVRITNPSANDQWTFNVGGKELFRASIFTTGFQNTFGNTVSLGVDNRSWLPYISDFLGRSITIPVPQGQSLTVSSVGGATANISMEYKEVSPADIQPSQPNHYQGNESYHPIVQYINTAQTAAGIVPMDTQIASPWVPKLLTNNQIPVNWRIDLFGMWTQPESVNTFSGAANHVSNTVELQGKYNGQQLFTRDNTGMPLLPNAAAAGSANNNVLPLTTRLNPFQLMPIGNNQGFDPPFTINGGDNFELDAVLAGDFTGGAAYNQQMILLCAHVVGSVGG